MSIEKVVRCVSCQDAATVPQATQIAPVGIEPQEMRAPQPDVAGRSASTEYSKRSARERGRAEQKILDDAVWREALKARRPVLGRLVAAATRKPTHGPYL